MALNIRQRQTEAVIRMLHLNTPLQGGARGGGDTYKVLILDATTQAILAPLIRVKELRRHGVTLHLLLDAARQPIPDVPGVYFVTPSAAAVQRIVQDAGAPLYDRFYLNFCSRLARRELEALAEGVAREGAAARISQVYDQYLQYLALEPGLFSLGLPQTYLTLNDPASNESAVRREAEAVADQLFCVLVTLGVVPIVRCPRGGAAEHVAELLVERLRGALAERGGPFSDMAAGGLAASLHRPLLVLFDRNFELSVMLQHTWTYKPLVHDVLGLHLNKVELPGEGGGAKAVHEVDERDFFWAAHGREPFPKVAEQIEVELGRYRQAADAVNQAAGAEVVGPEAVDPAEAVRGATQGLLSALASLPELTERKRALDRHANLATALLGHIKARALDRFYAAEEACVAGKAPGTDALLPLLREDHPGTAADKLRLALVWLLTSPAPPADAECERVAGAFAPDSSEAAVWAFVRRMRRLNLTGTAAGPAGAAAGGAAPAQLSSLLGQGLSSLTKGVKNLLAGEQQTAVTVAVEALMDGRSGATEVEGYCYLDPKARGLVKEGGAPAGAAPRQTGPFAQSIVFMIGGGNYLEAESLQCWAGRAQPTPKHVLYGATELLTPEQVLRDLATLAGRGV